MEGGRERRKWLHALFSSFPLLFIMGNRWGHGGVVEGWVKLLGLFPRMWEGQGNRYRRINSFS